ncbi:hypothetical protein Taro_009823 [Colocasia esculenta]|uniref:Uncharacterized protein n=1 Tax=Colocasia esculenta TaxID=4460 RepID=A0A843U5Z9_COLES|nr:hypothetical protein [Colocasia esculenta]
MGANHGHPMLPHKHTRGGEYGESCKSNYKTPRAPDPPGWERVQEIPTLERRNHPTKGPSRRLATSSSLHARAAAPHELPTAPQHRIAGGSPPRPEKRGKGREEEKGKKVGDNGLKPSEPENATRSPSRSQQERDTRHVAFSKVPTRPLTGRQAPDHVSRAQAPRVNTTLGTSPSHLQVVAHKVAQGHGDSALPRSRLSPHTPPRRDLLGVRDWGVGAPREERMIMLSITSLDSESGSTPIFPEEAFISVMGRTDMVAFVVEAVERHVSHGMGQEKSCALLTISNRSTTSKTLSKWRCRSCAQRRTNGTQRWMKCGESWSSCVNENLRWMTYMKTHTLTMKGKSMEHPSYL